MVMVTTAINLLVTSFYLKATTMPETILDLQPTATTPPCLAVDLFFDQVIRSVHRQEARAHHAEQVTGEPFCYALDATASFSGLPIRLLQRLCRSGERQAIKLSGWWLVHRDEFNRLLAPEVMLRCHAARQHILIRNLQQLAAMLRPHAAESTISVLLRDLRRAAALCGDTDDEAEDFVRGRAEWRVRDGIVDPSQIDDALRLVGTIIQLGMELFQNTDWRAADSTLVSMIAEQTGVDLAV